MLTKEIIENKFTGAFPVDIRVSRVTADSTTSSLARFISMDKFW